MKYTRNIGKWETLFYRYSWGNRFNTQKASKVGLSTSSGPNQVWTSDITYLWTDEGWLYLAIVLDLFNREVGTGLCNGLDVDLQSRTPQHGARRDYPETEVDSFNRLYF